MPDYQKAFVIHTRPYRETSLLIDCFGEASGRFSAVARGGRTAAKGGAVLRPFQPLLLAYSGRSELKTLTHHEPDSAAISLQGLSLYAGYYINELLLRLLPVLAGESALFGRYLQTLGDLSAGSVEPALRRFEFDLLEELGLGLDLGAESDSSLPVDPTGHYLVSVTDGVRVCESSHQGAVSGAALLAMNERQWQDSETLAAAKKMNRQLINQLLDGRKLHSREAIQSYLEMQKGKK